jgi:hypothetical protein
MLDEDAALMQGFNDAMTKEAALPALAAIGSRLAPMLGGIGSKVIGWGSRAAKAMGGADALKSTMTRAHGALGGGKAGGTALRGLVGAGTLGAGAAALGGAGYLASRR